MESSPLDQASELKKENMNSSVKCARDQECVINYEKSSDSDSNSEDLSSEDNHIISNSTSQFYEISSDSKIDYALKIDDNDNDTLSDIEDIKTDSASADSEDSALGSLPPDSGINDREVTDRSEGSDSGLGSESVEDIRLPPSFNLSLPCSSGILKSPNINKHIIGSEKESIIETDKNYHLKQINKPLRSSLKRCHSEDSHDEPSKKKKKKIDFDDVTVYYFPRAQGYICVPSQGGSTLGMEWEHTHIQKFTLAEHALEQRRLHRQILQQLKNEQHTMQGVSVSSSEDSDTEEEASDISESELDLDSYYFLQPVPTRQRRALLRTAGVRKIDAYEKDECRDIRTSREFCGCACKGICNPEICSCSQAGIKCQVDRLNFPCGCTREGCCNTTGRIEFNPVRVRTHFIHTLMRIGLEKKNENQEAAKRHWSALQKTNASCTSNTSYESGQCHEDGLLKDVDLAPRVEVESCVNAGSFNNVHCDVNNIIQHSTLTSSEYEYINNPNHRSAMINGVKHFDESNNPVDPYTSNILPNKAPYSTGHNMGFETSNTFQRFPCDLNYSYEQQSDDQRFNGLHSFSATRFEEFAQSSQVSMFNHYNHMYVPDYFNKPSTNIVEHKPVTYTMSQSQYEMYRTSTDCIKPENKSDPNYNTFVSLPYQSSNKFQIAESDENWFSQNTLLNLDHSDQTTQDAAELQYQPPAATTENNATEITDNFGELIKKTMVESVIV